MVAISGEAVGTRSFFRDFASFLLAKPGVYNSHSDKPAEQGHFAEPEGGREQEIRNVILG